MIPILPAIAVMIVLPFLVIRLRKDSLIAVKKLMLVRLSFFFFSLTVNCFSLSVAASVFDCASVFSSGVNGSLSPMTSPSLSLTMRVEYLSASSELCVTMMMSRVLEISLRRSMTCMLVALSSAPVGSSARMISGSLISARAIETRCI